MASTESLGLPEIRVPGLLASHGDSAQLTVAPDPAAVGRPVRILVRSLVSGCTRAGEVGVQQTEDRVILTPYDYRRQPAPGERIACSLLPLEYERALTLQFDNPGEVMLEVRGEGLQADGDRVPLTRRYRLHVRETRGYACEPPESTEGCR